MEVIKVGMRFSNKQKVTSVKAKEHPFREAGKKTKAPKHSQ